MMISRHHKAQGSSPAASGPPLSVPDIVRAFTERLLVAIELATLERGREIAAVVLAQIPGTAMSGRKKAAGEDREQRRLVAELAQGFLQALEVPLQERMRELLAERLSPGRAKDRKPHPSALPPAGAGASVTPRVHRQSRRRAPRLHLPPPTDPEQRKRDAEVARLRALLRPASEEVALSPASTSVASPVAPPRSTTPGDHLRALEKEIQDAVPSLAALGPERCGAQIAAWTGAVRELRDGLPADLSATMRPAFRIFLEHLMQLREAMEAHVVDALEPSWSTPDWGAYVEVNRACAEQRSPDLPQERLEVHHRTMLRALLKPHRRNVAQQALPIIDAAAKVLPPGDAQLRSAMRRHATAWTRPPQPAAATVPQEPADKHSAAWTTPAEPPATIPPDEPPAPAASPEEKSEGFAAGTDEVLVPAADAAQPAPSEFDLPWTQ